MIKTLDLNADVGESYGRFTVGNDEALIPNLSSCNVACGFHGGDPLTMEKTIHLALSNRVKIGAHPSYPDLQGFGRRHMTLSAEELSAILRYQILALKAMTECLGGKLHHVKPHGALNNDMCKDRQLLDTITAVVKNIDASLRLYVPYSPTIPKDPVMDWEVFADRMYEDDYTLTPRTIESSVITETESLETHLSEILDRGSVLTGNGKRIPVNMDTLCVHGDNPKAHDIISRVHRMMRERSIAFNKH